MKDATARRWEAIVDLGASAALGTALAWSGVQLAGALGSAAGLAGGLASWAALRRVGAKAKPFAVRVFDVREIKMEMLNELVLTDADRLAPIESVEASPELLLDDVLPAAGPGSRVVRLFDVSAMPTPGELKARIDRHIANPQAAPPDASQALFDALANKRLGWAALEQYGPDALLRSVLTVPDRRNGGVGTMLVKRVSAAAADQGVERLWLLTETAAPFFARLGFAETQRANAPASMQETTEFRSVCPASATCMTMMLARDD